MTAEQRLREVEQEILARRPEHAIEPTLDRIAELATLLGDPQRAYPVIHVTGTNGKTSTARMIEVLLRTRGLRTGLFTSPHLSSIRERIAVDGEPLSAEAFVAAYEEVAPYLAVVDERQPSRLSFFEVLAGMAFAAFADAPVDVAVIEVGLGGTWDATNIADGAVAVVTPVAIDHIQYLGDTIEEIAAEKAGIIKPGAVAVLGQQPVAAAEVLLRRAADVGASVAREGLEFGVTSRELAVGGQRLGIHGLRGDYDDLLLPLFGEYQAGNAACALAAVEAFAGAGDMGPVMVNGEAVAGLTEAFTFTDMVGVLAVSADKDVAGILDELEPVISELVVTRNSSSRSMDPDALAELAADVFGPERVRSAERLDDALEIAVGLADDAAGPDGMGRPGVLVTGSVITAGDARQLLTTPTRGAAEQG